MEFGIYTPWKSRLSVSKNSQIFNHLFLFLQVLHKKLYYLSFLAKTPQMCHHLAIKTLYFIYHFFIQKQDVGTDLHSYLLLPFEAEKLSVWSLGTHTELKKYGSDIIKWNIYYFCLKLSKNIYTIFCGFLWKACPVSSILLYPLEAKVAQ